jgi:hypothetical protein
MESWSEKINRLTATDAIILRITKNVNFSNARYVVQLSIYAKANSRVLAQLGLTRQGK